MSLADGLHYVVLFSAYAVLWFLCLFCCCRWGSAVNAIRKAARRSIRN
jgi:hypothetical protein